MLRTIASQSITTAIYSEITIQNPHALKYSTPQHDSVCFETGPPCNEHESRMGCKSHSRAPAAQTPLTRTPHGLRPDGP